MIAIAKKKRTTANRQPRAPISLSDEDRRNLLIFERRCDYIRDRVRGVAEGYQNGAFIYGRSGSGKTYVVTQTLEQVDACYVYRNSHVTPLGLFKELEEHREHTVVLDDVGSLLDERQSLQILLAAMGGRLGDPRPVTYSTANRHERRQFYFCGAIIAISNLGLRRDPLADAVASRVIVHQHEPTDPELQALMRHLASSGFLDNNPDEALHVVEFAIQQARANDYRLCLRTMEKALQDYRQWRDGKTHLHWQELVVSSMNQLLRNAPRRALTKQEEIDLQCGLVARLVEKYPDDRAKQISESGLSKSTFYERLRMLRSRK